MAYIGFMRKLMTIIHIEKPLNNSFESLDFVTSSSSRYDDDKEYPAIKMHSMYVNEFAADKRKRAFIILYMCLNVVFIPQITHSIEMSPEQHGT